MTRVLRCFFQRSCVTSKYFKSATKIHSSLDNKSFEEFFGIEIITACRLRKPARRRISIFENLLSRTRSTYVHFNHKFNKSSDYYCREKCAKCIPRSLLSHSETSIVYLSKSDRRVGIVIGWSRNLGLFSVRPSTFSKTQILKIPIRYRAGLGKPDRPKSMKNLKF